MSLMGNDLNPGKHERHLLRKQGNQLFPASDQLMLSADLEQARLKDQMALKKFSQQFQDLVQRAVGLDTNAPSEVILTLKEELDRCYQVSYTLPGDVTAIRQAIQKLLDSIMRAVWAGIGNDDYARQQLEDEEAARKLHFQLQQNPLIADLTDADSPVSASELIPSLLSETPESLQQVMQLFDEQQIAEIANEAASFLDARDPDRNIVSAWECLALIQKQHKANCNGHQD